MNVRKFYGIKNWAAIFGDENEKSEDEFLGKSDSDDEYVYCESITTILKVKKVSRLERKKSQMQTAWVYK